MKTILAWSLIVMAAPGAMGATAGPPEPLSWRYAHAEAQVLAGVDFRRLSQSPDGVAIRAQFVAALGAPLLDQTERLLMSSVFDSSGRRSDILILSGSFSLAQLRKMAMREGARMVPFKGVEIAAPPNAAAADPHLAWVTGPGGGTTVLIGTRPAIQAAAERSKAQVASFASVNVLFGRALELGPQFPIWISCEMLPAGIGPKSLDRYIESGTSSKKSPVEGFDIGIRTGVEAEADFWVLANDGAIAEQVLNHLRGGAQKRETFLLSAWLSDLKSTIEGPTLALGAALKPETAAAKVGPILAAFALPVEVQVAAPKPAEPAIRAKVGTNLPATSVEKVSAPAALKPMVVRIQGLDSGTREIPYSDKP